MKQFLLGLAVSLLVLVSALGGALADRLFVFRPLDALVGREQPSASGQENSIPVNQAIDVVTVAEKAGPSVVTVAGVASQQAPSPLLYSPFGSLSLPSRNQTLQKDIGSGFVVDKNLIVTNRHVVSDQSLSYKVIDKDDKEYKVTDIYRDPVNDLAILKIENGDGLATLGLGGSDNLKVGQFVVAIGTALWKRYEMRKPFKEEMRYLQEETVENYLKSR